MVSSNKFTFEKVIEMYVDLFNSLKKSNIKNPLKLKFINYIHVSNILSKKIHEIRNSDSIRFFMDDADIFSFEDHLIFIDKLKRCIDKKYWAVCKGDDYIGSIYLNPIYLDDKIAEWGIFINPHFSNNGYGTEMGELFFQFMKQSFSLNRILSKVKKNNTNSLCFHQKLGFEITKITKDYYQLEKTLIVE
jgi:UDP-4-amino-4,6-dideoxy-N-acetyl-beta-L-altrosamine N-acetyltransferase